MNAVIIHRHHDPHLPHNPKPFPDIIPNQELGNGGKAKKSTSKTRSPHTLTSFNSPEVGAPGIPDVLVSVETTQIEDWMQK